MAAPRADGGGALTAQARSVERTLDAAAIPPERRGGARAARLDEGERSFDHWILLRFAATQPPSPAALRAAAEGRGLLLEEALATLAREDLVHVDRSGAVAVAYPFWGGPPHTASALAAVSSTRCARSTHSGSRPCSAQP